MGSLEDIVPRFTILDDTRPDDMSLPAFMVSTTRGFLPRMDPIVSLPPEFDALESILQRMPVKTLSGEPGLLAQGKLGDAVTTELPDLTDQVEKYKDNLPLMNALYRDYSFLASAYLLEPCHERFMRGEEYGLARDVLPANVARPIAKCAALCGFKPFMEYAGSYALFNYRLVDPAQGLASDNLRLIRAFEHGLDPSSSEAGFVLVHIEMVKHSGALVQGAVACLDACAARHNTSTTSTTSTTPREDLNAGLTTVLAALRRINATMETMWKRSRPERYTSFRTFIFGITSQSMFPRGVTYAGVPELGDRPVAFRGESGANDSMVPLVDNLLAVPMPDTPLTEILRDFRSYRPGEHRRFLEWVKEAGEKGGLKDWALGLGPNEKEEEKEEEEGLLRETRALWIRVLDQIRDFRWRHWCFAREYIIKRTSHPTATGGSPIVTWLPNQLGAVMDEMVRLHDAVGGSSGGLGAEVAAIMDLVGRQREMLRKEVRKFCQERGVEADV
ncbi:25c17615-e5a0-4c16-87f5-f8559e7bbac7 [Thermothielavioides terrestris]|uniref:25c17615-e5a0-4c16-87f5-f8559e7bbac7 n=1 Tax=Thermothielavioides terrestris TaxID=2587410 RepID=A0A446BI59_9PEZI|nr:25c17615-e5a0-4c16-87f5-f8559e7bbac7 [Thermothielavioides terrestris]